MAKLYFRYGAMGSGKSIDLLKVAYNYEERNQKVLLLNSKLDDRVKVGTISTRIGIQKESLLFDSETDILEMLKNKLKNIDCILVDESQFLSTSQVDQLADIVDNYNIPVICYGLRADFQTELFTGSKRLLEIADTIEEIKTICQCGKKAIYNVRFNNGKLVKDGEKIVVGNSVYKSFCRSCYKKMLWHLLINNTFVIIRKKIINGGKNGSSRKKTKRIFTKK